MRGRKTDREVLVSGSVPSCPHQQDPCQSKELGIQFKSLTCIHEAKILDPSLLPPRVNISRKLELGVEARNKIQGLGCEIWDNSYSEHEHQQQLYCLWPRIMVLKCKNSKSICYQCDKDPRLAQLSKIHIIGKYNSIEVSSLFRI